MPMPMPHSCYSLLVFLGLGPSKYIVPLQASKSLLRSLPFSGPILYLDSVVLSMLLPSLPSALVLVLTFQTLPLKDLQLVPHSLWSPSYWLRGHPSKLMVHGLKLGSCGAWISPPYRLRICFQRLWCYPSGLVPQGFRSHTLTGSGFLFLSSLWARPGA